MWPRFIVGTALLCASCSGKAPPPPSEPPPPPPEAAATAPAETAAPVDVAAEPEPPPEPTAEAMPTETAAPPPSRPSLPPEPTCEELEQGRCEITQGCVWHSKQGCLEQEKPKTLDPDS